MRSADNQGEWYRVTDTSALPSPALLVYRRRVEENIRRMLAMAWLNAEAYEKAADLLRETRGPATNAAMSATTPTGISTPKDTAKFPCGKSSAPMRGGPKAEAGAERTETTPCAVPDPRALFAPM